MATLSETTNGGGQTQTRGGRNAKRARGDENENANEGGAAASYVKLSDGLKAAMGGRRFCQEHELTRGVLLSYLRSKGEVAAVEGILKVAVQPVSGPSFDVTLAAGSGPDSTVRALKAQIEDQQGTPAHRQELFVLGGSDLADALGESEALADDSVIREACAVALCFCFCFCLKDL